MSVRKIHENPRIFNIKIDLPGNPLRDLNIYVIEDSGEAMVIDTGFRRDCCHEGLAAGLAELGIPMERMKLFITHMHSDHAGQADLFAKAGCPVYMNHEDIPWLRRSLSGEGRKITEARYLRNGYPEEVLSRSHSANPMYAYAPLKEIAIIPVEDGTVLRVGTLSLTCIQTGGHTPGHTCLYLEDSKILFAGDHILYDITPNIGIWGERRDALESFISSLEKVDALPFTTAYPAHRELHDEPHRRIRELLEHHQNRLREALEIVAADPGLSAYTVASRMKWSIRCNGWEDFPASQKWFAVGEGMSHLDWLEARGYIEYREQPDGQIRLYPKAVREISL